MSGRVSVLGSRELQATVLSIKAVPRELQREIRVRTKQVAGVAWQREIASRASTVQESRVIERTARISVSNQNVMVRALGSRRRALSGGLIPVEHGAAVEFGSNRYKQFRPAKRQGYVFWQAVAEMTPRLLALWAQTTARTILDALDGGHRG